MRRVHLTLAVGALVACALCLAWGASSLPWRGLVRGHLGDVAAAALLYALLGLALPWRARVRLGLAAAIALGLELAQAGTRSHGAVGDVVLGAHFDPWDLGAYALGLAAAWRWEHAGARAAPAA